MRRLLPVSFLFCSALIGAILVTSNPSSAEQFRLNQLQPDLRQAIGRWLRAQDIAPGSVMISVTTADCPQSCNDVVLGGMCHCSPNSNGQCGEGQTPTTRRGEPSCMIKPTTASISDGTVAQTIPPEVLSN